MLICKHCGLRGEGKYCSHCGEIYEPYRITIHSLMHEVIHTFTHADKGLLYTLKNLAIHPGIMQKNYLEGERKTNQKPFSLFFICASVTAIALHYVNAPSPDSQSHFDITKGIFYKNYFVMVQALLIPFYALLTWAVFYRRNFNYAEALVLFMYSLAFSLLIIIPINFLSYFFTSINEQLVELVLLGTYMIWTNFNFFREEKKWIVVLKSVLLLVACYFTSNFAAEFIIRQML
jgi:hypothetical protein